MLLADFAKTNNIWSVHMYSCICVMHGRSNTWTEINNFTAILISFPHSVISLKEITLLMV